jgi:Putative Ig domain
MRFQLACSFATEITNSKSVELPEHTASHSRGDAMKSFRVPALAILALTMVVMLVACGGGGKTPTPPAALAITTSVVPTATVNVAYSFFLAGTGGTGTYTWSISGGALPPGLTLSSGPGQISGTPTTLGVYAFTAQVTDGAGNIATANLSMTVEGVIGITCQSCASGTTLLPSGNPGILYSATLTASGGKMPYTWCVIESSGACDNGSQGALPPGLTISTDSSGNGIISGTPTTPGTPTTFTVQVSDSETIVSRATASLTITIFDIGPKTLPNATLNSPYNENISAIGGIPPYTFTLTGSLPPGLSFGTCVRTPHATCPITGTPTQVGTTQFTVSVSDGENPAATATANLSITVGPLATNGTLTGTYAIVFSGYKSGNPFQMVGSVAADGNGNITAGKIDYNDGSGEPLGTNCHGNPVCPAPQIVQTGSTYDLTTGNGTGSMTINTLDSSNNPHTYTFSIAVSGRACVASISLSDCGQLIEDDAQMYGSGALKVQDTSYFAGSSFFPGNFAILVSGIDPAGNRYAAAGAIGTNPHTLVDIDCNGNGWDLSGCPLDTNDNGNNGSGATVPNPYTGSFSADIDSNTGRGNFVNMKFASDPQGLCLGPPLPNHDCGFVYYIINYTEMILMSSDPTNSSGSPYANLTTWTLFRQKSSATGWGLTSTPLDSIMELTANDGGKADVTTGLFTTDQAGNGTFASDENDGGTLNHQAAAPGTYAVGTAGSKTGQFLLSGFPQFGTGGAVMYLWSGNGGNGAYLVGTDAKVTSGTVEMQQAPPPGSSFSNASVSGNYAGGTVSPAIAAITNSVTYLYANGVGQASGSQFTSGPGGANGPNPLTLTYQVDSTGRGVVLDQNQNQYGFLYVVSPNKFSMVPTGSNPALNIFITGQPD